MAADQAGFHARDGWHFHRDTASAFEQALTFHGRVR